MKYIYIFCLLSNLIMANCKQDDIAGYYLSPKDHISGRFSIVEIVKKDGRYYGYNLLFMDELPVGLDIKNDNNMFKNRSILGSVYIYNLERTNSNKYINGRYYDFNTGKTFHLQVNVVCNDLNFIVSLDRVGILGNKKLFKGIKLEDAKFYIKNKPKIDFSGIN